MSGLVEVLFRDSIDQCLQQWNLAQGHSSEWITQPAGPLQHIVRKTPSQNWRATRREPLPSSWWEARAECSTSSPNHDDLVAGLSFGTWTSILPKPFVTSPNNARLTMWNNALKYGFGGESKEAIYRWAHEIRYMRNRASHLRPMLNTDRLRRFHRYSIRLLRSMDEDFGQVIAGLALIPNVIKDKP
ncbi:Abi-like protein [Corynebacterium cystitidis DSM 20524]|nr:Abi-like protein [Corynebacterium cystitidis DSM 20524]SNV91571.1 Abi-like protein [Corynebacterium cystitidis]